jgi:hypothetical protein
MPESAGIVAGRGGLLAGHFSQPDAGVHAFNCTPAPRECWIPVPIAAPVLRRKLSRPFSGPHKSPTAAGFARQACGSRNGTIRQNCSPEGIFLPSLGLGPFTLQPLFRSEFNSLVSLARLKVDIAFAGRSRRSAAHRALPLWQNLACIRPAFRPSKLSARSLPLWSRCAP